ncbi:MAG: DUF5615 family PIN-like protein [bacterium]
MKILLDENLPDSLVDQLTELGHNVDSVNRLDLKGIENGALYHEVASGYDFLFTKDAGFAHNVRQKENTGRTTLIHVVIPQSEAETFSKQFIKHFTETKWNQVENGDQWPEEFA